MKLDIQAIRDMLNTLARAIRYDHYAEPGTVQCLHFGTYKVEKWLKAAYEYQDGADDVLAMVALRQGRPIYSPHQFFKFNLCCSCRACKGERYRRRHERQWWGSIVRDG